MKSAIAPGRYLHYKGREYQVLGSARHSETEETVVVYFPLYGDPGNREYWVRPLAMFTESVVHDGKTVDRFALVEAQDVAR